MSLAERLLHLYPRTWRERYGEEFLALVGPGSLHPQQIVDIVSGAIDAWLSADVRRATPADRAGHMRGGRMTLNTIVACERRQFRATRRDSLVGAAVMIGATLMFLLLGGAAERAGRDKLGEILTNLSFHASLLLSMPFWLMTGQPRKAQVVVVAVALVLLVLIGIVAEA